MKTILIVEDTDLNLDLLTQLLEDNYKLLRARDGSTGVAKAVSEQPDLILMDMSLPVMDGFSAVRAIRSESELAGVSIIGLSARAMPADREKALQNGCDVYLTKPIDEDLLVRTIEELIGE